MQSKTHWSYLAAMIDGEGSIATTKGGRYYTNKKGETKYYYGYSLCISVSNNSIVLMKHLLKTFGGVYYPHKRSNPNANDGWLWMPKGMKNKKKALLAILPYLIIKREQALLALEFIELQFQVNPEKREEIHQKFLRLNKRGKSPETNTQNNSENELKIESELHSDMQSELAMTQVS